jgi:MFS family permease
MIYSLRELANYGFAPLTSFMGQTIHGFSPAQIGLMLSLVSLPGIIIQPLFGYLSDRIPRELITIVSLFTAGVFVLLIPWAPAGFMVLCFLLVGAASSANIPVVDAITAEKVPAVNRSTVYGFLLAVGIGAGSFSPVICGWILDANSVSHQGFKWAYLALFLFGQAAALTMLISYLRERKKPYATRRW